MKSKSNMAILYACFLEYLLLKKLTENPKESVKK